MRQMQWWVVVLMLTACSSKEEGDAPGNVLVKGTISSTTGAMIFHDADPNVVLSIPPSAVTQDIEITISTPEVDLDADALSPVIAIAPEATALSFPGSVSIGVDAPTPNSVIARVTENGLERLPGSVVDVTTHEVQAPVQRLGRFVVVDGSAVPVAEAESTPTAMFAAPAAQDMPATDAAMPQTDPMSPASGLDISGTWQGTGQHQDFELSLVDSKFTVSREGRVVREGSFNVSGNSLSLVDSAGKSEVATVTLANDEMTLDSAQSGVVRWQLVRPAAVAEAAPSGFFSTDPAAEQTMATTPAVPPAGSKPTAAPKPKTPSAQSQRNSTVSSANAPRSSAGTAEEPKKNIFQRIGSGLKAGATGVVRGVQNLGKSNANQAAQAASATVAQSEQQLAAGVNAATQEINAAAEGVKALGSCDRILGDWAWSLGGTVNFSGKDRVRWSSAVNSQPAAVGTWKCAPGAVIYTVTWQNGFIDTLNLAADGLQLGGVSSTGATFSGQRISGFSNSGISNSSSGGSSNNASSPNSTADGWTPIGNGGFGKQSTVPMSGGVPQRIGPQGRPPPKGAG